MSLVPLPWCTSQSTIITRSRPCASRACCAATATLLNRQKPIARSASAWCPGGRWMENPVGALPASSRSTSETAPPQACGAAVNEPAETTVSASIRAPPRAARRSTSSTWRGVCTASSTERSAAGELTRSIAEPAVGLQLAVDRHHARGLLGVRSGVVIQRRGVLQQHGRGGGHRRVPYLPVSAQQTEVAVVGAGAAGLYTALCVARAGRRGHAHLGRPAGRRLQLLGAGRARRRARRRRHPRPPPRRHHHGRARLGAGVRGPGAVRRGAGRGAGPHRARRDLRRRPHRPARAGPRGRPLRAADRSCRRGRHRPADHPPALGAGRRGRARRGAGGPPRHRGSVTADGRAVAVALGRRHGDHGSRDRARHRRRRRPVAAHHQPAGRDRRRACCSPTRPVPSSPTWS